MILESKLKHLEKLIILNLCKKKRKNIKNLLKKEKDFNKNLQFR